MSDEPSRADRLFRLLLRAYPPDFRRRYGAEMAELFHGRLERAEGTLEKGRVWTRVLRDTLANAWAIRRSGRGRELRGEEGMMSGTLLLQDLKFAIRHLVRAPGFTLVAVALLAIGIGANITAFTVVDTLLFRAPPWDEPDRVVFVYQDSDDGEPSSSSYPATRDMRASGVFAAVGATCSWSVAWDGPEGPTEAAVEFTTSDYLEALGRSPQRGRWFGTEHDTPGGAMVAVVSDAAWRSKFGADPSVVGRTIRLNGQPVTLIGIGPENLPGTNAPLVTDFWLSISSTPVAGPFMVANLERREDHWYQVRARLAPGVTVAQARSAMDALAARLAEEYPELNRGRDITVFGSDEVRMHPDSDGGVKAAGGALTALAVVVLLVVAANLANLLLVRGVGRSAEMAVRRALGAGRNRVVRLFLAEAGLLAVAGGVLGVLLARWALAAVPSMPIPRPAGADIAFVMDARVALFSLALIVATGLLFGAAPALRAAKSDVAGLLRDDRSSGAPGRGTSRFRNALVGVQLAASVVLVMGTGLLVKSLVALQTVDTGVDADRVAFVRMDVGRTGVDAPQARALVDQVLERVRALPGVTAAGATSRLPATGGGTTTTVVEGYVPSAGTDAVEMPFAVVSDGYFEALGIPLLAGRAFGDEDVPDGAPVILVNEASTRRFWPGEDPIGRRNRGQGSETWRRVIGVVGDAPVNGVAERVPPMMYFSGRQSGAFAGAPWLVVRTDGAPEAVIEAVRREIAEVRPAPGIAAQGTLRSHFGSALDTPRFVATLLGSFALLAVALAGLGIYAVVSFSVARRAPELGLRMALGAERGRVVGMVVREVAATVLVGLAAGMALAYLAASRLGDAVYGVSGLDPFVLTAALLFLLSVAFGAAWWPARRAARADPVESLRST